MARKEDKLGKSIDDVEDSARQLEIVRKRQLEIARRLRLLQLEAQVRQQENK